VYSTDGEAYFAELRIEMVFRFPEVFVPPITDLLKEVDVEVDYGNNTGVDIRARYLLQTGA